jgi:2-polyprenyl-6-methoxyphenol hydroxylase-like FAD-dependent oxidoreductase
MLEMAARVSCFLRSRRLMAGKQNYTRYNNILSLKRQYDTRVSIEQTNVVIVGAGPSGLMLAMELALQGVKTMVLERLLKPDETIKAGTIGALGAEALERRGLGPAMDIEEGAMANAMAAMREPTGAQGGPAPWTKIGGHFAGLFLIDQTRQREPERRVRGVRQQVLELMLAEKARQLDVDIRRGVAVTNFQATSGGVEVFCHAEGGEFRISCAYLVGCDGGRSLVRKRAGFEFPGTEPTLTGHQAIVELDHPERLLPVGWRRTSRGMLAYGPAPGRILVLEFDGPPADRDAPVTLEELQRSLQHVSGAEVRITSLKSATRFTDNARQVTAYRRGRVLLAGDAAHVHSPFGGQGLNLGLVDAVNLGWKLAAVVRGRAAEGLLDTYTEERQPVAARILANTRAQVALMRPDELTSALRDIVAELMNLDEGNRFFGEMMSGITTRYALGADHPLVGRLAGNLSIATNDGVVELFSLMQQGNGVLIDAGDGSAAEMASAWDPLVRTIRALDGVSMLIRPDGCIAWVSTSTSSVEGLKERLLHWFGKCGPVRV